VSFELNKQAAILGLAQDLAAASHILAKVSMNATALGEDAYDPNELALPQNFLVCHLASLLLVFKYYSKESRVCQPDQQLQSVVLVQQPHRKLAGRSRPCPAGRRYRLVLGV
jgi:hypothetical protein